MNNINITSVQQDRVIFIIIFTFSNNKSLLCLNFNLNYLLQGQMLGFVVYLIVKRMCLKSLYATFEIKIEKLGFGNRYT